MDTHGHAAREGGAPDDSTNNNRAQNGSGAEVPAERGWQRPFQSLPAKFFMVLFLTGLGDGLFYGHTAGAVFAIFAGALLACLVCVHKNLLKTRGAKIVLLLLTGLTLSFIEATGPLSVMLFCLGVPLLVLSSRWRLDASYFMRHAPAFTAQAITRPFADRAVFRKAQRQGRVRGMLGWTYFIAPVLLCGIFLYLFSVANPVMARRFDWLNLDFALGLLSWPRALFWLALSCGLWAVFRPTLRTRRAQHPAGTGRARQDRLNHMGISRVSVTLSLIAFNLIFAAQNAMDIFYLWSGAGLPEGMSYARYAQAGAYPLVATILIAAGYVLVVFREENTTLRSALITRLVYIWILQNMFLLASAIYRNYNYVDAFSLTYLRLAAFIWMAVVGAGLFLVIFRIASGKTNGWLVNMNMLTLGGVLYICCLIDFGYVVSSYNVRHAVRACNGEIHCKISLDLYYIQKIGPSAYEPLLWLKEKGDLDFDMAARVNGSLSSLSKNIERDTHSWRKWTWRSARVMKKIKYTSGRGASGK